MSFKDHFSSTAAGYAKARPTYPAEMFAELARLSPARDLAWDAGAGNGQASVALAEHFTKVVATEPSAEQLRQAIAHPRVEYHEASETDPRLADASVDLVTAAQAAHWFDRATFYAEIRRVARPGAVVALWTYEMCEIAPEIDAAVLRFYRGPIEIYWPPERRHVETSYRELQFPFREQPFPPFAMEQRWTLADFTSYLRTWSAVTRYKQTHGRDPVDLLEAEIAPLWGAGPRNVRWPLSGRLGTVGE